MLTRKFCLVAGLLAVLAAQAPGQAPPSMTPEQSAALKQQILKEVDGNAKLVQVMIDTIYSFGELGFPGVRDVEVSDDAA